MSNYKAGQDVLVIGPSESGLTKHIGQVKTLNCALNQRGYAIIEGYPYPLSSLQLVPTFAPGVRVRLPGKLVRNPGDTETTIKAVYKRDGGHGPHDLYELESGGYHRADELELAPEPKREPSAQELLADAGEYIRHLVDCPAIGGHGDDDCTCGAVRLVEAVSSLAAYFAQAGQK